MGNPSSMEMPICDASLPEVLVVLPTDPGHLLLEAGELVLQIFEVMLKDVQLSRLPANHLRQFIGLEKAT